MFCVVKAILRVVFLKNLVMNFVSLPTYVNLAHFVFGVFSFILFSIVVNLFKIEVSFIVV
jgi:hypothetical protein